MLYGSEAWCLREKQMAILRRTERVMAQAMCGVKLLDRRNSEDLMDMLGIKESLDRTAEASSMRWYSHVLRKDEKMLVKALKFEESGSRGRPKQMWKKQVENEMKENGLVKEDAWDRTKGWGVVKAMNIRNPANSVDRDSTESNTWCDDDEKMLQHSNFGALLWNNTRIKVS